ncbi:TRAP transporter small permease [Haloglomus litoreum]|uniref:TRAP transporter small permease n=1 Tax=Haloglomus litoreum TaxID=3034026 RepID=UPI0023E82E0B|nr:TRAP transporter small permease [Haloglomus sp. DT116]
MNALISILAAATTALDSDRVRRALDNFEGYLAALLLFVYLFIILYDVGTRNFGRPPVWGQEVVLGLFIWLAWLSTAYAVRTNSHLRFTLVFERLSQRGVYAVYVLEWVLWVAFAGVIFWYSLDITANVMETGTTVVGLPIPVWLFRASIPVGFGLILLRVAQRAVITTRAFRAGEEIGTDVGLGE